MSDFLKVLNERTSAEHFDSATPISVQEIKELISEACQAPSGIQHPALALHCGDTLLSGETRMKSA